MSDPGTDFLAALEAVKSAVRRGAGSASPGRRASLERCVDELTGNLLKVAKRPDEPTGTPTVRFTKTFGRGGERRSYYYAAIRADDGYWYLTGIREVDMAKRYTWDELLTWLDDYNRSVETLRLATRWEPLSKD